MNAEETRTLLDDLARDKRHLKGVRDVIDALVRGREVGIRDSHSAHCSTNSKELRDAIKLCLQMDAQRVEAKIKATQERIENWK